MEEETQYRGASLVVVAAGGILCLLDWAFANSGGPPDAVVPFGLLGFFSIVGGLIWFWKLRQN